jgi:hypothetical protein
MKKKSSNKEFVEKFEQLWKAGPEVKYENPEAWRRV